MAFVITPYVVISGIGASIAFLVALIAWQRQMISGGKSLTALMFAVTIWSGGAALEYASPDILEQIFWAKIEYFGTVSCPVFFLLFALEYNHMDKRITRKNIFFLFIIPIITLVLTLTNEWHGLIWSSFSPSPAGDNLTIFGHGIFFWIGAVAYSYLIMLVGTLLLIRGALGLPGTYRRQVVLVIAAAIAPWLVNLVYITGFSPTPGLELTPLVILISGIILALAIFQFHLLDLVPIARDTLVETMTEGVLVLDQQNRVVDANPAAQRLLGKKAVVTIGKYVGDIFTSWPELRKLFLHNNPETRTELSVEDTRGGYLEINISPVHDQLGQFTGQFVVLRDITEKRRSQDEIQRMNEYLRLKLTEIETLQAHLRERAIRDSLTGLFNRRYLDETFERELARAKRDSYAISVLMIDIDHFKRLNDTFGHKAGDQVLKSLGDFLLAGVREGDIVCRYGGEEFLIIMPSVNLKDSQFRAESICQGFSTLAVKYEEKVLHSTISIGVAIFPQHGSSSDEILRAADTAMYIAKQAGRNTVCVK